MKRAAILSGSSFFLMGVVLGFFACDSTDLGPVDDISETIRKDDALSSFYFELSGTGVLSIFSGTGKFTVFAPTNAAFNALPGSQLEKAAVMLGASGPDILRNHILRIPQDSVELLGNDHFMTYQGSRLDFSVHQDILKINRAVDVVVSDISASNGIIHKIDALLLPPVSESLLGGGSLQDRETSSQLLLNNLVEDLLGGGSLQDRETSSQLLLNNLVEDLLQPFPQTDFLFSTDASSGFSFPDNYLSILASQLGQSANGPANLMVLADSVDLYGPVQADKLVNVVFKDDAVVVVPAQK